MSSFSGYPASLRYVFSRLAGYARNRSRMPVTSPVEATHGDTIVYEIGPNQLVDLSTITFGFNCTTTADGGTNSHVPPSNTNCLVENLMIEVNGIPVQNTANYHHVYDLYAKYHQGNDAENKGKIGDWVSVYKNQNSVVLTNVPLVIRNMLGFFASGKCIDTGLTGPIRVSMRVADSKAMITKGSPTSTTFKMTNMYISYDTISISDGIYNEMMQARLASGGMISIPFTNFTTYMGSLTNVDNAVNRIGVNCQSLDYILHTVIPEAYNGSTSRVYDAETETSAFFNKGHLDIYGSQVQVGSVFLPNYRQQNALEIFCHTTDSLNLTGDLLGGFASAFYPTVGAAALTSKSLTEIYTEKYFLHAIRLCHGNDFEYGSRLISGLDCRGSSVQVSATTYSTSAGNVYPFTIILSTAQLNIAAHRQLQFVA